MHADLTTLLRWQNRHGAAARWRNSFAGGEWDEHLDSRLNAQGIRWAKTFGEHDVEFLRWAVRTRRGCHVMVRDWYGKPKNGHAYHSLILVALGEQATLIDPNYPTRVKRVPANDFLKNWFASDSWAVAVVYAPAPPQVKGRAT